MLLQGRVLSQQKNRHSMVFFLRKIRSLRKLDKLASLGLVATRMPASRSPNFLRQARLLKEKQQQQNRLQQQQQITAATVCNNSRS